MPQREAAEEACDVLVIGAGFVGLSVGAGVASHSGLGERHRLRIIEQGPECGAFWRGGHENLSLHSPHHRLPHDDGLALEYPMFKTKHEVRDYVTRYASAHGLGESLSFGETVLEVEHRPQDDAERPWRVRTDKREHRARRVVVATGLNRTPHVPSIPGSELRDGRGGRALRHSWDVWRCDEYAGERVLIVGSGNSSAELAVALHEAGAASVDLLVDAPRHYVRRSSMARIFHLLPYVGLSTEGMVHELHRCTFGTDVVYDPRHKTAWARFQASQDDLIQFLSVDLSKHGIRKPPSWNAKTPYAPRIPVYDVDDRPPAAGDGEHAGTRSTGKGVIDLILSGDVGVRVGRLCRFTSSGVVIEDGKSRHTGADGADGANVTTARGVGGPTKPTAASPVSTSSPSDEETHIAYDSVILATGFRHRMHEFITEANELLLTHPPPQSHASPTRSAVARAVGSGADGEPRIDASSRSTVIPSIYFVGMDQFKSTLSIGPVLGYRGYDVGASIAAELYGAPPNQKRWPALPDDEQGDDKPLISAKHALGVVGGGMAISVIGSIVSSALRRRPPPPGASARTLVSVGRKVTWRK